MCVGVCLTRRGMLYFSSSIHIFVTLILFIGSSVRAVRLTTYEKEDSRKETLGGFIIATYFFVLLMLGLLIFRATEQKNAKLLGWCGGIFITLETFAFVINLMVLSPMGSVHDEYGFRNFGFSMNLVYIVISCIFLLCMMGYCATIIMYVSKLKEDGDVSSAAYEDPEEQGSSTSNAVSRTSSHVISIFNRSQSQSQLNNKQPGLGGMGGGGGGGPGGGAFNILEVVKEAKRQKQLKEQQELRDKQKKQGKQDAKDKDEKKKGPSEKSSKQQKQSDHGKQRPQTPASERGGTKDSEETKASHSQSGSQGQLNESHAQVHSQPQRPQSRHSSKAIPANHQGHHVPPPNVPPREKQAYHDQQQQQGKPLMKSQEQQTQTPPQVHVPHLYPHPHLPPPNLLPNYNMGQGQVQISQTLPPRRTQLQQMHRPHFDNEPLLMNQQHQQRPYFLQEYSQRGVLSAPSFASMVNTASIVPHRFRNPSAGLRTTKSGTLLGGRYDSITPPPPSSRLQSLQREISSSCSSFDPLINPNSHDLDRWEIPRLQALDPSKYPASYNALRRGTHRSDYGLGVEV